MEESSGFRKVRPLEYWQALLGIADPRVTVVHSRSQPYRWVTVFSVGVRQQWWSRPRGSAAGLSGQEEPQGLSNSADANARGTLTRASTAWAEVISQ